MSANNFLLLNKTTFTLQHKDMESDVVFDEWQLDSLEEAVDKAQEFMDSGEVVEYGCFFE